MNVAKPSEIRRAASSESVSPGAGSKTIRRGASNESMVTVDDRTDDEFDAFLKEVGGTVHVQADGGADDEFDAFMKEVGSTVQVICVDDDSDACMDEEAAVGNLDDEFDAFMNEVGGILRDDEFDAFMNEV